MQVFDELVSVTAVAAPLRSVLQAMAGAGLIEIVLLDALEQRIDVDAGPLPVHQMHRLLLRDESYTFVEGPGIDRLWVMSTGDGLPAVRWAMPPGDDARLQRIRVDLADPDPEVREEAALETVDLDAGMAVDLLLPALQDRDPGVREAAVAVLDELGMSAYALPRTDGD